MKKGIKNILKVNLSTVCAIFDEYKVIHESNFELVSEQIIALIKKELNQPIENLKNGHYSKAYLQLRRTLDI